MNKFKIELKDLYKDDNFDKWAKSSFASEEFSQNLLKYVLSHYGDVLKDCPENNLEEKLDNICNEIITKYDIDEQIIKEFHKIGYAEFLMELNNLEINTQKLEILKDIITKTNTLAEKLGVPDENSKTIVIDDDEEMTLATEDEDVKIVSLESKQPNEEPVKASIDISYTLQYVSSKELLAGYQASVDMLVFVKAHDDLWLRGTVQKIYDNTIRTYDVFMDNGDLLEKMSGTHVACIKSALDSGKVYPVGSRIITVYSDENGCSGHYSGIVAEPPANRNSYRYLVFFDDGYVQYSKQNEVFLMFSQNVDNWKQMNSETQEFVKNYLRKYPERPMVRMKVGQQIKIEYNGDWCPTLVEQVDASLSFVCFANSHREWIYRGSTRIEALYKEIVLRPKTKGKRSTFVNSNKHNRPVVEYTAEGEGPSRKIARKSTSMSNNMMKKYQQNNNNCSEDTDPYVNVNISDIDLAGTFIRTLDHVLKTRPVSVYKDHTCNSDPKKGCLSSITSSDIEQYKGCNPLEIAIFCGWFRVKSVAEESGNNGGRGEKVKTRGRRRHHEKKESIYYVAPCGRRLRTMAELDTYLIQTGSLFSIELFSFEPDIRVNREFQVQKTITSIVDISYGKENVPVSCVNSVDNDVPPFIDYMPWRHIMDSEDMSLHPLKEDPDFLSCCDCTDGCRNRAKCACIQLTVESAHAAVGGSSTSASGYINKRLYQYHPGGIFECNSRCSCKKNGDCKNRVVQNGLWNKLQIFKTERKGWGIRTLHDIPRGAFVCIYAGTIYDEAVAVEEGRKFGDEYQAELDYIETLQDHKDGYESDVVSPDEGASGDEEDSDVNVSQSKDAGCDSNDEARALLLADSESDSSCDEDEVEVDAKEAKKPDNNNNNAKDDVIKMDVDKESEQKDETVKQYKTGNLSSNILKSKVTMSKVEGNVGNITTNSKSGARRHTSHSHIHAAAKLQNTESESGGNNNNNNNNNNGKKVFDIRQYLGDPNPFIMDAKRAGNLGRYFNHSCDPNLFVQNVFISSHDLRYPEVAFFAKRNIEAGEEITWDYMYRVGSVPDKILYCYCGSSECRGRLL